MDGWIMYVKSSYRSGLACAAYIHTVELTKRVCTWASCKGRWRGGELDGGLYGSAGLLHVCAWGVM